jgi:hypothetical protein
MLLKGCWGVSSPTRVSGVAFPDVVWIGSAARKDSISLKANFRWSAGSISRYLIPFPHGLIQACSERQEYILAAMRDAVVDVVQKIVRC